MKKIIAITIILPSLAFAGDNFNILDNTSATISGGTIDGAVIGGTTPASITGTTITANTSITNKGNLTYSGTGLRVLGDFSNATVANRLLFQTSTSDGNSNVGVITNGAGNLAQFVAFGGSDPANTSAIRLHSDVGNAHVGLDTFKNGTGTVLPMDFQVSGVTKQRFDTDGRVLLGTTTNNGVDELQVAGSVSTTGAINKVTLTAPATGSTLTIANGKTLTASNTLTFAGTDSTTMTFPSTSATIARTDAANTFTGHQTIEGVTSTGATGTGNLVFSASPTFTGTVGAANVTLSAGNLQMDNAQNIVIKDSGGTARNVLQMDASNHVNLLSNGTGGTISFQISNAEKLGVANSGQVNIATAANVGGATLTLPTGGIGMAKIAADGSAPGAGGAKLEVVCGTNAGTAKLIMYAGTSATPVTVVDNVGGGVTGC